VNVGLVPDGIFGRIVPINHKYTFGPPTPLGLENLYCLRISFSEEYLFHNGFSVLLNIVPI